MFLIYIAKYTFYKHWTLDISRCEVFKVDFLLKIEKENTQNFQIKIFDLIAQKINYGVSLNILFF